MKGIYIAIAVTVMGISIPLITMVITLSNKPDYATVQPDLEGEGCFAQLTWQQQPEAHFEHLLIFLEKPEEYKFGSGLDTSPPEEYPGFYILPRGVFYDNKNLLKSVQKRFRRQKIEVCTWFLVKTEGFAGKAFPVVLTKQETAEIRSFTQPYKFGMKVDEKAVGERLKNTKAWKSIKQKLGKFKDDLKNKKLDMAPRKKAAQFMTF